MGVGDLSTTLYQCRHGGPSRDIQLRLRDLAEVQRRGHWQAASSLRNYGRSGRLRKLVAQVPDWVMSYGEEVRLSCAGVSLLSSPQHACETIAPSTLAATPVSTQYS